MSLFDSFAASGYPIQPSGIPLPSLYNFFIHPVTPLVFGLSYFVITKLCSRYSDGKNRLQGVGWNRVVVVHNLILAVYSGWTFCATAPIIFGSFLQAFQTGGFAGLLHTFCDSDLSLWSLPSPSSPALVSSTTALLQSTFPFWCYTFYLSKYYEVLDTVIILAKGKKVGMLQSYHHTGAVWTMYAGFRTMSMPIWIFVVFNSAIHTLMYCYYAFSAMKLPFPQFLKKNLTRLQITQFLIGGSLAASYLFIRLPSPSTFTSLSSSYSSTSSNSSLVNEALRQLRGGREGGLCVEDRAQRAAVWLNVMYLIPLTYLFAAFFFKSYKKNQKGNTKNVELRSKKVQ